MAWSRRRRMVWAAAPLVPLVMLSVYLNDRLYEHFEIRWLASLIGYSPLLLAWQFHLRRVFLPAPDVVGKWIVPTVVLPWIAADGVVETFGEHWWTEIWRSAPVVLPMYLYWRTTSPGPTRA